MTRDEATALVNEHDANLKPSQHFAVIEYLLNNWAESSVNECYDDCKYAALEAYLDGWNAACFQFIQHGAE